MINAWSLLYDELLWYYGRKFTLLKNRRMMMTPKLEDIKITSFESDEYDPIVTVGSGNTAVADFKLLC